MPASARLQIRLTDDERAVILRAARSKGMTVTAFVLRAAIGLSERITEREAADREAEVRARVTRELAALTQEQEQSALASGRYIDADGDEVIL